MSPGGAKLLRRLSNSLNWVPACAGTTDALALRQLLGAPAAAERLDQADARGQAPAQYVDGGALVRERGRLRGDHVEVAHDAGRILVKRQRDGMSRRLRHLVLQGGFLFENAQGRQVVLDFLEAGEHRLPVGRALRVV